MNNPDAVRPYAAFLAHTVKPLLQMLTDLVEDAREQGLQLNAVELSRLLENLCWLHLGTIFLQSLVQVGIALMICVTLLRLL